VEVTASSTSTLVIPATTTETDFTTVIATTTVVVPNNIFSPVLTTLTALRPGTTSIGVSTSVATVDAVTTSFVFATTTSVVPFQTVTVITPVGVIGVDQSQGYLGPNVVPGGGGGGIERVLDKSAALNVIMIQAQSPSGLAVYMYALNPASGINERYVGLTQFVGSPNTLSGEFFSDGPLVSFVSFASYGPPTQIQSSYIDDGNPGAFSEAVVFSFDPSSAGLSVFWVNPDHSVFPLFLETFVPNSSGAVQFVTSNPVSFGVFFDPVPL